MALENTFRTRYSDELVTTLKSGNTAAWGTGIGNGTGTALPYFVQGKWLHELILLLPSRDPSLFLCFLALLIYVSAIFIAKGIYDFPTMMQVYSLVLFSVTFASQFMDFSESLQLTANTGKWEQLTMTSECVSSSRNRQNQDGHR